MPARVQIQCVTKSDRYNPHERILGIGGSNQDGTKWYLTQENAIQYIEAGTYQFYVRVAYHEANVVVAVSQYGNKYIKTEADGDHPNNLLSLPECQ